MLEKMPFVSVKGIEKHFGFFKKEER